MFEHDEYEQHRFFRDDFSGQALGNRRFFDCRFERCVFTGANFSGSLFENCRFENCDLSLIRVDNSRFHEVEIIDSKIQGVAFNELNRLILSFSFQRCRVNDCLFSDLALKKMRFIDSELHRCDFSGAVLVEADFSGSDLTGSLFNHTQLVRADLRAARGYSVHPLQNNVRSMYVSLPEAVSFLSALELKVGL